MRTKVLRMLWRAWRIEYLVLSSEVSVKTSESEKCEDAPGSDSGVAAAVLSVSPAGIESPSSLVTCLLDRPLAAEMICQFKSKSLMLILIPLMNICHNVVSSTICPLPH